MATTKKPAGKSQKPKKPDQKPSNPLMINGQSWDRQKCIDILFNRIASSSKSIVALLKEGYEGWPMPEYMTIRRWIDEDPDLCEKYARVKEAQAEYMADEMMDIADEPPEIHPVTGGKDSAAVQHQRLRIDTRKWLMGKLKPKKYGDKLDLNHSGSVGLERLVAGE